MGDAGEALSAGASAMGSKHSGDGGGGVDGDWTNQLAEGRRRTLELCDELVKPFISVSCIWRTNTSRAKDRNSYSLVTLTRVVTRCNKSLSLIKCTHKTN